MRTIIAGSRDCTDERHLVEALMSCGWTPTVVISGAARGADSLGEAWAKQTNTRCERFPADWALYGKRAGYLRNEQMAAKAEALIALWDGKSKGTKHMIEAAQRKGLRVYVYLVIGEKPC